MGLLKKLIDEIKFITTSRRLFASVADIKSDSENLVADDIEKIVDLYPDNIAFISDEGNWTYKEFDEYANRVASWALSKGLKRGDTVAIFVTNRLEYIALWFGLSKIGVIPALLNYQLRAKALAHCVNISKTKIAIIEADLIKSWQSAGKYLDAEIICYSAFGKTPMPDFCDEIKSSPNTRPDKSIRKGIKAGDLFMKMFTSGTTGLPKAAKITHTRAQLYMRVFVIPAKVTQADRMIVVLPLYHATGGLCAVGMVLYKGGAVIVRRKFSSSTFWQEAVKYKATLMMYVGELCRFLVSAPENEFEHKHNIRCIIGNGLRPEVWEEFIKRFGIDCVIEFYGATEGNVSMLNFTGKIGAIGRIPFYAKSKFNGELVRFDIETGKHIRGSDGFMIKTEPGEIGELIGEIRTDKARYRYEGYEDKQATSKKILHNVFKKGDKWFRTGDLLWRDKQGYYYFADRIGDTFRWKAENVSTNEVASVLSVFDKIEQANVYGVAVPGYDGKAGMASLVVREGLDLAGLHKHVYENLPAFARPVFLRTSKQTDTTGTFKYKKTDLVKQGFNPEKIKDRLYIDIPKTGKYTELTAEIYQKLQKGEIKL